MMASSSSLVGSSFNLPSRSERSRREEEKEGQMGYLTMANFKGRNFNGDYLQSLSSFDRLRLVATLFLLKENQDEQSKEAKAIKNNVRKEGLQIKIKPPKVASSSADFNSPTMAQFHPLAPGLVQGKYFNLGFGVAYPLNKKKKPIEPNWVLYPKKPRTASNFGQNSTMRANDDKSLKRKYNDGDGDDKAWAAPKNNKKKIFMKKNKGSSTLYPHPDLPEEYKELIIGKLNGTELRLLIQKELFTSDVNPNLNRLSLPPHQVLSNDFLKPDEIKILHERPKQRNQDQGSHEIAFTDPRLNLRNPDQGCLKIPFIDPRLKLKYKKGIYLKMWKLSNSETIRSYVLRTTWSKVVNKNKLVEGDVIQVWSFRANNNQLHLAIVMVKKAEKSSSQSAGSASNSSEVFDGEDQSGGEGSRGVEGATAKLWTGKQKIHLSEKQEDDDL